MLPQVAETRIVGGPRSARTVLVRHRYGPIEARYHLRMIYNEAGRAISFELDRSRDNDIDAGWGYLRIRAWGQDRTLISFGVLVDADGVVASVVQSQVREWILRIPSTIKGYVEGRGRERYASR